MEQKAQPQSSFLVFSYVDNFLSKEEEKGLIEKERKLTSPT